MTQQDRIEKEVEEFVRASAKAMLKVVDESKDIASLTRAVVSAVDVAGGTVSHLIDNPECESHDLHLLRIVATLETVVKPTLEVLVMGHTDMETVRSEYRIALERRVQAVMQDARAIATGKGEGHAKAH